MSTVTPTQPVSTAVSPATQAPPTPILTASPTADPSSPNPPSPTEQAGPVSTLIAPTFTPVQPVPTPVVLPEPTQGPTPAPTVRPTVAPTIEPCRITYPTEVVSGPSVPDEPADGDRVFRSLTVHPSDPDTVLLGTERNGFMLSEDGGATWTRLRAGMRSTDIGYSEIWDIDYSVSDPNVIMAATLDSPGPANGPNVNGGLYRSVDGGQTWAQLNCGFPTSRAVSVRIDPSNSDVAVVGLEGGFPSFTGPGADQYYPGGIFRTEDGGQNWDRVSVDPNDGQNGYVVMRMTRGSQPQIVTFGADRNDPSQNVGFMRSRDMGLSWELFAPEFRTSDISTFDLSSDGQTIYVNQGGTYFGWFSKDGGQTWDKGTILQVNGPIAVSPVDSNLVVFSSPGDIRRSTDGLASMSVVKSGLDTIREIVFSPSHPNVVYAEADGYILYRSDDAGLNWRLVVRGRDDVLNAQP